MVEEYIPEDDEQFQEACTEICRDVTNGCVAATMQMAGEAFQGEDEDLELMRQACCYQRVLHATSAVLYGISLGQLKEIPMDKPFEAVEADMRSVWEELAESTFKDYMDIEETDGGDDDEE